MRKILLILFFTLSSVYAYAENSSEEFFKTISGNWYGEGFNVHFGEYKAHWKTLAQVSEPFSITGTLEIIAKDDSERKLTYQIEIRSFFHTFSSSHFIQLAQSEPIPRKIDLVAFQKTSSELMGWKLEEDTDAQRATGFIIRLSEDGSLIFGFSESESYCFSEKAFCLSDTYSPFVVKKVQKENL